MDNFNSKIYVAGHRGLVGSAIVRTLRKYGYKRIIMRTKKQLNLTDQKQTFAFLKKEKPKFIFIAAAKVGGIKINNILKANFIYENLAIEINLIHGAFQAGVKNLIFLGSNCVYPKNCKQPIKEEYLLSGPLEITNEPYAIAKIAGIKVCESYNIQHKTNYRCLMPTNMFGPNDNYNLKTSHFIPALIKKTHLFKIKKKSSILLWGNPSTKREVMYVDDLAEACIYFMKIKTKETVINIGSGIENTIIGYAKIVSKLLNVKGKYKFHQKKLVGLKRKILDSSIAKKYGWKPKSNFFDSIIYTYKKFLENNSIK
jgi:GDP-L-fucose synthase